jgi:hypothetical protein
MNEVTPNTKPIALRTPAERHAHVAQRMLERGGISWTPEQVLALEKKIRFVRNQINLQKPVAPILPMKIGEEKDGAVHRYRVLIQASPHTFIWAQACRGLISYAGPGELPATTLPQSE